MKPRQKSPLFTVVTPVVAPILITVLVVNALGVAHAAAPDQWLMRHAFPLDETEVGSYQNHAEQVATPIFTDTASSGLYRF